MSNIECESTVYGMCDSLLGGAGSMPDQQRKSLSAIIEIVAGQGCDGVKELTDFVCTDLLSVMDMDEVLTTNKIDNYAAYLKLRESLHKELSKMVHI